MFLKRYLIKTIKNHMIPFLKTSQNYLGLKVKIVRAYLVPLQIYPIQIHFTLLTSLGEVSRGKYQNQILNISYQ